MVTLVSSFAVVVLVVMLMLLLCYCCCSDVSLIIVLIVMSQSFSEMPISCTMITAQIVSLVKNYTCCTYKPSQFEFFNLDKLNLASNINLNILLLFHIIMLLSKKWPLHVWGKQCMCNELTPSVALSYMLYLCSCIYLLLSLQYLSTDSYTDVDLILWSHNFNSIKCSWISNWILVLKLLLQTNLGRLKATTTCNIMHWIITLASEALTLCLLLFACSIVVVIV